MWMWIEEALAGKKVNGVKVHDSRIWLDVGSDQWIEIAIHGDCCSQAFIDAVCLEGNPTLTGKYDESAFPSQVTTQEVDRVVAIKFHADRGSLSILHRNSSNGYYGNFMSIDSNSKPPPEAEDARWWHREVWPVKTTGDVS